MSEYCTFKDTLFELPLTDFEENETKLRLGTLIISWIHQKSI